MNPQKLKYKQDVQNKFINNLVCPVCDSTDFCDEDILSEKENTSDIPTENPKKEIIKYSSYNLHIKSCKRCGYMMIFKQF